jgi:hypothetical protein
MESYLPNGSGYPIPGFIANDPLSCATDGRSLPPTLVQRGKRWVMR